MLREGDIKCFAVKVRKDLALLQRNAALQPPSLIDGILVERLLPELVPVCSFRYTKHENYATCQNLFVQIFIDIPQWSPPVGFRHGTLLLCSTVQV